MVRRRIVWSILSADKMMLLQKHLDQAFLGSEIAPDEDHSRRSAMEREYSRIKSNN
uniref:Uncharacterized protein n=1 Tax=Parascaris equorum TaxID=6256 RepID=A0A914RZB8_PAREQ